MEDKIKELVNNSQKIVVIQADNPDADSLGSALALEQILGALGKEVALYCGIDIPKYLRYLSGWDRIAKDLPVKFDLSIIVDTATLTLLDRLTKSNDLILVKSKPCIVIDHHEIVDNKISFAEVQLINPDLASTGEVIFSLANYLNWPMDKVSGRYIMASILGDTQGLTNESAKPSTYRVMASLCEIGVSRPELEEQRRLESKMTEIVYRYKAELIKRTTLIANGQIATVTIPQMEINEYSPLYNPSVLVQFDMLMIESVKVSIIFKTYDNGRLTAKIRCNPNAPIAGVLANYFGGGGHEYSSGFKIETANDFSTVKNDCLNKASKLLANL